MSKEIVARRKRSRKKKEKKTRKKQTHTTEHTKNCFWFCPRCCSECLFSCPDSRLLVLSRCVFFVPLPTMLPSNRTSAPRHLTSVSSTPTHGFRSLQPELLSTPRDKIATTRSTPKELVSWARGNPRQRSLRLRHWTWLLDVCSDRAAQNRSHYSAANFALNEAISGANCAGPCGS